MKNKSSDKQKSLKVIAKSNKPINKKIMANEKADPQSREGVLKGDNSIKKKVDPEPSRNRKRIKPTQKIKPFFQFIFSDLSKIIRFGKKSHTITTGFLPFMLRINKDVHKSFRNHLQKKYIFPLIKILKYISETGWLYLTKRQYNLVILFYQLCHAIFAMNFNLLSFKKKESVDKMKKLENLFLIMHYRFGYMDEIINSIKIVINETKNYTYDTKNIGVMVKRILLKDFLLPSLYNFILAINMVTYRRYLTIDNLINRYAGHVINTEEFDCTDIVRVKINVHINDIENNLGPVVERRNALLRLKSFLPANSDKKPDYKLLEYFYNDRRPAPPLIFLKDRKNIIYMTINLATRYLDLIQNFLSGQIEINSKGTVEIFSQRFFSTDINKLMTHLTNLQKASYTITSMTLERFYKLKDFHRGGLAAEVEIVKTLTGISTQIEEIGHKISEVILNRQETIPSAGNYILELVILTGKKYCIPYENARIVSNNILHGRTVLEALSFITCLSYISALFYKQRSLLELLRNEGRINKNIQSNLQILQRIANSAEIQRIKTKYKI